MMRRFLPALMVLLVVAVSTLTVTSRSQTPKTSSKPKIDNTPIKPMIPSADRSDLSRVFLESADTLKSSDRVDYQILVGKVKFRRGGMFMYCDSAHFYDKTGSFNAYGNVKMEQGDTLFVYADELTYSDSTHVATLYADFNKKVRLINRDVTLLTDVFNYNLDEELGYYEYGGELFDDKNRLVSTEGEYSPATKDANFRGNVNLTSRSETDTLDIRSQDLQYNTATHIALITTAATIRNGDGTIHTSDGIYNTETTEARLFDHSTVEANNGNTLTGDTLFYDRRNGWGEAFGNMEINDIKNSMLLTGDYGYYNELIDSAFVTGRARAMEYSQTDTLYIHADSIRAFRTIKDICIEMPLDNLPSDSVPSPEGNVIQAEIKNVDASAATADSVPSAPRLPETKTVCSPDTVRYLIATPNVKFFRNDIQGLCDSMSVVSSDTILHMHYFPVVWSEGRQITGDIINIHLNDSTVDWAKIPSGGYMVEYIEDGYYNQLKGKEMHALFENKALSHLDVSGNVQAITFPEENDSTINKVMNIESSFLAADFDNNAIKKLKLWSETNAVVTPLYLAKKSLFFLPGFRWLDEFRPYSPDDIFTFPVELVTLFNDARAAAGAPQRPLPSQSPEGTAASDIPTDTTFIPDNDAMDETETEPQKHDDNETEKTDTAGEQPD